MDNIEKIDLDSVDWQSSRKFFDSLKDELKKLDDHTESYDFTWVGKRKSIIEAGAPINKTLRPDVEASKDFDNTKNMLIVGDNLDALKVLQESYLGQVKMIYIDPPYNTGHDFVYHDKFAVKKDDYDDNSMNEDGEKMISEESFKENSRSNGRFHSDWLSMIYPRLKLARNLLSDDGVIFISIDDNEQANLKKVCDEIFGEENVESMIWRKIGDGDAGAGKMKITYRFRTDHEYIICCYRNIDKVFLKKVKELPNFKNTYGNPDNDTRGAYKAGNISKDETKSNPSGKNYYTVVSPNGKAFTRQWHFDELEFKKLDSDHRIYWGKNNDSVPALKIFVNEPREIVPSSIISQNGSATLGNKMLTVLFDGMIFENPKPEKLIKYLLGRVDQPDPLILDFFAGSGTTGHAVMDLNAEDGGNRRYILVQLPEATNEKSEARKAGYETIDQITAERLRRAGEKVQKEHPDAKIDTGFRVFRIDDSNEKENIRKPLEEYTQESMLDMVDNLKSDRAPLDLLFGAIYASALSFDLHLETRKIGDNTVYLYGYLGENSGLVACFDDSIADDTVKEIAKLKPLAAVFRDSSFADSTAKINLSEHFRVLSVDTKVKVI